MLIDIKAIEEVYRKMSAGVETARKLLKRPMTLTEKILYGHLSDPRPEKAYERGADYVNFSPDRVAMQDAHCANGPVAVHDGRQKDDCRSGDGALRSPDPCQDGGQERFCRFICSRMKRFFPSCKP